MKKKAPTNIGYYDRTVAYNIGMVPAIVVQFIRFWSKSNKEHKRNYVKHEGVYWCKASYATMCEYLPELNKRTVMRAVKTLIEHNIIFVMEKDNINWYRVNEEVLSNLTVNGNRLIKDDVESDDSDDEYWCQNVTTLGDKMSLPTCETGDKMSPSIYREKEIKREEDMPENSDEFSRPVPSFLGKPSKVNTKRQATTDLNEVLSTIPQRTSKPEPRKPIKHQDIVGSQLVLHFRELFTAKYPGIPFTYGAREKGQMKALVKELVDSGHGRQDAFALVDFTVNNWTSIRKENPWRLKSVSHPTLGHMYAIRDYLYGKVYTVSKSSTSESNESQSIWGV